MRHTIRSVMVRWCRCFLLVVLASGISLALFTRFTPCTVRLHFFYWSGVEETADRPRQGARKRERGRITTQGVSGVTDARVDPQRVLPLSLSLSLIRSYQVSGKKSATPESYTDK